MAILNIVGRYVKSSSDVYDYLKSVFYGRKTESIVAIGLRKSLVRFTGKISDHGGKKEATLSIEDTFSRLKDYGCDSFIIAHNHPSGIKYPSKNDLIMTETLMDEGRRRDCELLEHIIYSGSYWDIIKISLKKTTSLYKN